MSKRLGLAISSLLSRLTYVLSTLIHFRDSATSSLCRLEKNAHFVYNTWLETDSLPTVYWYLLCPGAARGWGVLDDSYIVSEAS